MLEKIKANLNYALCAFLGAFHFVVLSFNYISAFSKYGGERDSNPMWNGYKMMSFGEFDGCNAQWLAVINGILQILLLILAIGLLAYGVMGLLKAFGQLNQFPGKIHGIDSKALAGLGLLGYAAITALLFILMIIWSIANTESMSWGGEKIKIGVRVGFGMYFALVLGGLMAAAPIVLPKYVSGLNKETAAGPQISYRCSNCGQKMKKTDKFCNVCGGAVTAVEIKQMEYVCSNCGRKVKKTDKFCNACGGAVVRREVAPAAPVARGPVCPACGKPVAEGQRFCTSCGTTL